MISFLQGMENPCHNSKHLLQRLKSTFQDLKFNIRKKEMPLIKGEVVLYRLAQMTPGHLEQLFFQHFSGLIEPETLKSGATGSDHVWYQELKSDFRRLLSISSHPSYPFFYFPLHILKKWGQYTIKYNCYNECLSFG